MLLTASDEVRKNRVLNRGDNPEEVKRRLEADEKYFEDAESLADIILDTSIMLPFEIEDFAKALVKTRKNM